MPQVIVNVSMPNELKNALNQLVARGWYTSVSEVIREGARRMIESNEKLTVNGFTEEFENEVLRASRGSRDEDLVIENEAQLKKYFQDLKKGTV